MDEHLIDEETFCEHCETYNKIKPDNKTFRETFHQGSCPYESQPRLMSVMAAIKILENHLSKK